MSDSTVSESSTIPNIMSYGSPSAKAEVLVKLIMIGKPELVTQVFKAIGDKELYRIIGKA